MTITTTERRDELAAYLRSRRARVQPADVGLPAGTRRRVAGLRREEVAQLAGVGLTWYTWLEQGRPISVSTQVLSAVARALRLSDDEREHLFGLCGAPAPERPAREVVRPEHLDALEKLMPYPAVVQTARFDILAYNQAYRFLFEDFDEIPDDRRNCAILTFTDPVWARLHVDIDHAQARVAARLRGAFGRHHEEPGWQRFVARLRAESPRFEELWTRGDVASEPNTTKRLRHPVLGDLSLRMTSLWLDEVLSARLVWFSPLDEATAERLPLLAAPPEGTTVARVA